MEEKRLLCKRTKDDLYHLYLDDPALEGFNKLDRAKKIMVVRDATHIVLWHGDTKILWCIIGNEVYSVGIPLYAEVKIIEGHTLYELDSRWYVIVPGSLGGWHKELLGERFVNYLSCPYNVAYGCLSYCYFLRQEKDKRVQLTRFVRGKRIVSEWYQEISEWGAKLFALREPDLYDVFVPNKEGSVTGEANEAFEALKGVLVWSVQRRGWLFYPDCSLWGKNSIYRVLGEKYGENVEFYRIEGETIRLIAKGSWCWKDKPFSLCIEGMSYVLDEKTNLVDFDNPKPTLKRRIKDFFK